MSLHNLHVTEIHAPRVQDFISRKKLETEKLKNGDETIRQAFWIEKNTWIELQECLGEVLLDLQSARLRNANIIKQFLKHFGSLYVEIQELILNIKILERLIQLKENMGPEITREAVEKMDDAFRQKEMKKILSLKERNAIIDTLEELEPGGPIDNEELGKIKQQIKTILKELYRILYPDMLEHHPAYQKLTDGQKHYLKSLWLKLMAIKDEKDLVFREGMVFYTIPTLERLIDIKAQARVILENAGLDVNLAYVIQGETINDQLLWLEKEIEKTKTHIARIRNETQALKNDPEIKDQKAINGCPENYGAIEQNMEKQIETLSKTYQERIERYEALFCKKNTAF